MNRLPPLRPYPGDDRFTTPDNGDFLSRVRTFYDEDNKDVIKWPNTTFSPEEMAGAGFTYKPTRAWADNVHCASCEVECFHWENQDSPFNQHSDNEPTCAYVNSELFQYYHSRYLAKKNRDLNQSGNPNRSQNHNQNRNRGNRGRGRGNGRNAPAPRAAAVEATGFEATAVEAATVEAAAGEDAAGETTATAAAPGGNAGPPRPARGGRRKIALSEILLVADLEPIAEVKATPEPMRIQISGNGVEMNLIVNETPTKKRRLE